MGSYNLPLRDVVLNRLMDLSIHRETVATLQFMEFGIAGGPSAYRFQPTNSVHALVIMSASVEDRNQWPTHLYETGVGLLAIFSSSRMQAQSFLYPRNLVPEEHGFSADSVESAFNRLGSCTKQGIFENRDANDIPAIYQNALRATLLAKKLARNYPESCGWIGATTPDGRLPVMYTGSDNIRDPERRNRPNINVKGNQHDVIGCWLGDQIKFLPGKSITDWMSLVKDDGRIRVD